jgi:ribosomal subunit interface protein
MHRPLKISFHGVEPSEAIERRVREHVARLERFHDRIIGCDVAIEEPHRQHRQGNLFGVRLLIRTPTGDVVINRANPADHSHEDFYVALRDAFAAAQRKLEDSLRTRDHRTKVHEPPPHGRVVRIFPQDGYGFLETSDEIEVYFHENSVVNGAFAQLNVGDEVRLTLAPFESTKGPQASTVSPIGKHHLVERRAALSTERH